MAASNAAARSSLTPFVRVTRGRAIRSWLKVSFLSIPRSIKLSGRGNQNLRPHTRRRFLAETAATAAGMFLSPDLRTALAAQNAPHIQFPAAARDRIAIASYPFRDFIAGGNDQPGSGKLELKEFAAHVSVKFSISKIEPWSAHFRSLESPYLKEIRAAVEQAHGTIVNIAVDGEHSPYAADPAEREKAVAFSKQWIDAALAVGAPSVRTNIPPAKDSKPDVERTAQSLKLVAEYA